jgi:hypothetical protein
MLCFARHIETDLSCAVFVDFLLFHYREFITLKDSSLTQQNILNDISPPMHLAKAMTPHPKGRKQASVVAKQALTPMPKARATNSHSLRSSTVTARQALTPMPKARSNNHHRDDRPSAVAAKEALTPLKSLSVRTKAIMHEPSSQREARASYAKQPSIARHKKEPTRPDDATDHRGLLPSKHSVKDRATNHDNTIDSLHYHSYGPSEDKFSSSHHTLQGYCNNMNPSPPTVIQRPTEFGMAPLTQENLKTFLDNGASDIAVRVIESSAEVAAARLSSEQKHQNKGNAEKRARYAKLQERVHLIEDKTVDHRSIEEQAFLNKFYKKFRRTKTSNKSDGRKPQENRRSNFRKATGPRAHCI